MKLDRQNISQSLMDAVPPDPGQLFRLQRLCVRLYTVLTRDLDQVTDDLVKAAGGKWPGQKKQLGDLFKAELPILIVLRVLEGLENDERFDRPELAELLRGLLLPLFALRFQDLHEQASEQMKRVHSRIDWYLDFESDDPVDVFCIYCGAEAGSALKNPEGMKQFLLGTIIPEVDQRLQRTLRGEFL